MVEIITVALAATWAWETLLTLLPGSVPVWLQPLLVGALCVAALHVPAWVLTATAASGGVALLHHFLVPATAPRLVVRRRERGLPPL